MSNSPKKPNSITPWLIIPAVALIFFGAFYISPSNKHYNPADQQYPIGANNHAEVNTPAPVNINPITNEEEPASQKEAENYAAGRSDLAAQWAMAEYTFVGLGMGALGLILIGFTYWESRKAAYFTEQALNETKISSRKELRAYLVITAAIENYHGSDNGFITVSFENTGQSPAINLTYRVEVKIDGSADDGIDVDKKISIPPAKKIFHPVEVAADLLNSSDVIICEIFCGYNDIFGGERFIKETKRILGLNLPNMPQTRDNKYVKRFMKSASLSTQSYEDDLQKEAEEYAEANKTS